MKEKSEPKESKEEKARRALYEAINGRLSEMRGCLKSRYMHPKTDEIDEDVFHGINKGIHDIEHIFWDLLMEEKTAGEIFKDSTGRLGTRILPVPYGG